ncbi:MAG: hypothetical protein U1D25_12735 [Hydrogenophaga sp.]|uniref:hypothetical protein n=1 Tax=Hydrogenophaga sp. TaxID=1904254 RepID=UPI002766245E|nr:hypothetical protein [Hydrogenophaga sp.]MDP2419130.1 hypothetical protein [Hydrogenophaga sp.]MDZ4188957.1 hypothetical protein [Hydrogenophaga sp.]
MDGLDISVFEEHALYIIHISSYGSSDKPDNATAAYESLAQSHRFMGMVPPLATDFIGGPLVLKAYR